MTIPVFYRVEQNATIESSSPSAGKPKQVVADWQRAGLDIVLHGFEPLTPQDLMLAHDPHYVRGVLAGEITTGFNIKSAALARSMLYTTGSMFAAAKAVCATPGGIACSPTSGFHHANYDAGFGFCTFNGLIITARKLQQLGLARQVAIVDLDMHYGDGTDDILSRQSAGGVAHFTAGAKWHDARQAEAFLRDLPQLVRNVCDAGGGADVVLYQAGADPHIDDPLGGWLTDAQLRRRDAIVFQVCRELGVPVAWNLAGGYQRDAKGGISGVLAIHRATMEEAVRVAAYST